MKRSLAPTLQKSTNRSSAKDADSALLWLKLSAFLSLRSTNTQRTYLGIVEEWCEFLGSKAGSIDAARRMASATDMQATAFRSWLNRKPGEIPRLLKRRGALSRAVQIERSKTSRKDGLEATLSNATIAKKFAALRRMYRALMGPELGITLNPFDSDRVPPPPKDAGRKRPTEMINFDLVEKIMSGPDLSTPKGRRDLAALAALFGGGLRRSELIHLRIADLRTSAGGTTYLYLRSTKAKRDAEQALPKWAATILTDLADERRKDGAAEADYLFVSFTGPAGNTPTTRPLSDGGVYALFKRYCILAGAGEFVTPHSARATAITKLLADGVSHREVQGFSRHASIQMVELYDKRRIGVDESSARGLDFKIKPKRSA